MCIIFKLSASGFMSGKVDAEITYLDMYLVKQLIGFLQLLICFLCQQTVYIIFYVIQLSKCIIAHVSMFILFYVWK